MLYRLSENAALFFQPRVIKKGKFCFPRSGRGGYDEETDVASRRDVEFEDDVLEKIDKTGGLVKEDAW